MGTTSKGLNGENVALDLFVKADSSGAIEEISKRYPLPSHHSNLFGEQATKLEAPSLGA